MDSHDAFTHVRIARISLASARISSGASPPKSIVELFRCQNLHFLLGWFPQTIVVHPLCTESHLMFQA